MDQFDFNTKALERAEKVIRTVLANETGTDISTILPLLGFSSPEDALNAADRFGDEARRASTPNRTSAVKDAKAVVAGLSPAVLTAIDRKRSAPAE